MALKEHEVACSKDGCPLERGYVSPCMFKSMTKEHVCFLLSTKPNG